MSNERIKDWGRKLSAGGAAVACVGALAGSLEGQAEAQPASAAGVLDCAQLFNVKDLQNGKYRACFDYISDAAEGSLQLYYKTGRSRAKVLSDIAKHHLESRYFLGARKTEEKRVAKWGLGVNEVHEKVDLVSVTTNAIDGHGANRALIKTREQWDVIDGNGRDIFHQASHIIGHTLCRARIPFYPDASWLVVKDSVDPNYDCLNFQEKLTSGQIQ